MKIFKTQEEINQALNSDGNLIINDSVTFECSFAIAGNITAWNISAWNISAGNISARDISALDITAWNITAWNISAWNITALDISARDIDYYAVCVAYNSFTCKSIIGKRKNSKHFCLDSEIEIAKGK